MEKTRISQLIKGEVFQTVPGSIWYEYLGYWNQKFHYMSFDERKYESDEMEIFT